MWPTCSDEQLLEELSVIVTTGWDLPSRPNRQKAIRHLLLLTGPTDNLGYTQGAQRLLQLIDEVLRDANDEVLGEDDRTGCRILLGVMPTYRAVASPTRRRADAADFLVSGWQDAPPRDPAGTFQRRHQRGALRQILECLRRHHGSDGDPDDPYDIARSQRWYHFGAGRQITSYGDTTDYRVLEDGLDIIQFLETTPDPGGLLESDFVLESVGEGPPPTPIRIRDDPSRPGYRRISVDLPRQYEAGEILGLTWREELTLSDDAPDWGRVWVCTAARNEGYALDMMVTFGERAELPDLCWWFSAEPNVDLNEVGPCSLDQLIDLGQARSCTHRWSALETQPRRLYGLVWVWFDHEDDRKQWETLAEELTFGPTEET